MRALTQTNARARGYSRGVRGCARMFLIRMMLRASREGSRGASAGTGAGAGAAPDEDNASLPLSYEPGPAIINSSKHSFSYTQLYVVLSPTKRSPPMSFSMPAMVLIAGGPSVAPIYGYTVNRRCTRLVDDAPSLALARARNGNGSDGERVAGVPVIVTLRGGAPIYRDHFAVLVRSRMNVNMTEGNIERCNINFFKHSHGYPLPRTLRDFERGGGSEFKNSDKCAIRRRNVGRNRFRQVHQWLPISHRQKRGVRFAGVSQGHEILVSEIVIAILFPQWPVQPRRAKQRRNVFALIGEHLSTRPRNRFHGIVDLARGSGPSHRKGLPCSRDA